MLRIPLPDVLIAAQAALAKNRSVSITFKGVKRTSMPVDSGASQNALAIKELLA